MPRFCVDRRGPRLRRGSILEPLKRTWLIIPKALNANLCVTRIP